MVDVAHTADSAAIQRTLGPYERWLAEFGKDYDLPSLKLGKLAYLSGLVQFGKDILDSGWLRRSGVDAGPFGRWKPRLSPLVWHGPAGKEFHYRFLPMLLEPAEEDPGLESFFNAEVLQFQVDQLVTAFTHSESIRVASLAKVLGESDPGDTEFSLAGFLGGDAQDPIPPEFKFGFPLEARSVSRKWTAGTEPGKVVPDDAYDPAKPLVIVAIIDDGIPFAHRAFRCRKSGRTRIDFYWSQSAKEDGSLLFGREISGQSIDKKITRFDGDEDVLYGRAEVLGGGGGPISSLAGSTSHGAHVAGLAAGEWPEDSEANVRIIAVDLPASSSWDTSGFGKDMFVLSAMHYIFERADRIADAYGASAVPLIINLSYGYSGGPKDGTGLIEQAMGEMIEHRREAMQAPTALVMPSGNMFLDRLHAVVTEKHISEGRTASLPWRISPEDRTSSFLEIWLPAKASPENFRFAVTAPDGIKVVEVSAIAELPHFQVFTHHDRPIGQLSIDRPGIPEDHGTDGSSLLQSRVLLALAPTETVDDLPAAPSGLWHVEISYAEGKEEGLLHGYARNIFGEVIPADIRCWIQRDVSFGSGNVGAKQSFFDDPLNHIYDANGRPHDIDSVWEDGYLVRRFGSINGMSTHRSVIVVGGYVDADYSPAPYSSAGCLRKNGETEWARMAGDQVDCAAPCESSPSVFGIESIGTRTGIHFPMNGTSVAAPQVTRKLAMSFMNVPAGTSGSDDDWIGDTAAYVTRLAPDIEIYRKKVGTIKEKHRALIGQGLIMRQTPIY